MFNMLKQSNFQVWQNLICVKDFKLGRSVFAEFTECARCGPASSAPIDFIYEFWDVFFILFSDLIFININLVISRFLVTLMYRPDPLNTYNKNFCFIFNLYFLLGP